MTRNQGFTGNHGNPTSAAGASVGPVIAVTTCSRKRSVVGHVVPFDPDRPTGTATAVSAAPSVRIGGGIGDISTVDENLDACPDSNRTISIGDQLKSASTGATGSGSAFPILATVPPSAGSTTTGSGDERVELTVSKSFAGNFGRHVKPGRSFTCIRSAGTRSFKLEWGIGICTACIDNGVVQIGRLATRTPLTVLVDGLPAVSAAQTTLSARAT